MNKITYSIILISIFCSFLNGQSTDCYQFNSDLELTLGINQIKKQRTTVQEFATLEECQKIKAEFGNKKGQVNKEWWGNWQINQTSQCEKCVENNEVSTQSDRLPDITVLSNLSQSNCDLILGEVIISDTKEKGEKYDALKKLLTKCKSNSKLNYYLGNFLEKHREKVDSSWTHLALGYYYKAIEIHPTEFYEARWKLANLLEYTGLYNEAIVQYKKLETYQLPPLESNKTKKVVSQNLGFEEYENFNFKDEAKAHLLVCEFLKKTREPEVAEEISVSEKPSNLDRIDFSQKAIEERSGWSVIEDVTNEIEEERKQKPNNPKLKKFIANSFLDAMSYVIAPDDMKIEYRNRLLLGAITSLTELVTENNLEIKNEDVTYQKFKNDLKYSKDNNSVKSSIREFKNHQEKKETKIQIGSELSITQKFAFGDLSGEYDCINCLDMQKAGISKENNEGIIITRDNSYLIIKDNGGRLSTSQVFKIIIPASSYNSHGMQMENSGQTTTSIGNCDCIRVEDYLDCNCESIMESSGYTAYTIHQGIGKTDLSQPPMRQVHNNKAKIKIHSNGDLEFLAITQYAKPITYRKIK